MKDEQALHCYRSWEAMGTRFEVFLRGDDEEHLEAVAVAVWEEVVRLEQALSRFDPRSEIARINREAFTRLVRIDRELFALLARCEQARVMTEGYFDVTRGKGMSLTAQDCTVQLAQADATIDLGGVGKGYVLDRGRDLMLRYGVASGLLQGGTSSVLAVGNELWPIDVRHPSAPARIAHRLALKQQGFSCSAVRHAGQRKSDVVNPLTGELLTGADACVVLAANATDAEIFSTALLAMGRTRTKQYLAQNNLDVSVGWADETTRFAWINTKESA